MTSLLLSLLFALPAAAAETEGPKDTATIKEHYDKAFRYYQGGGYSQAILEWTEVLKLDPNQSTAQKMLRNARDRIDARDKEKQDKLFTHVAAGRYNKAFIALQALLERDPTHPLYKTLETRLELVVEITEKSVPRGKAWRAALRGMTGYLARKDDLLLAYNGLLYARELDPKEKTFAKLLDLVIAEAPELARRKMPPGIKILDYKREVALHHIYDGKYHEAVNLLKEVIALEAQDVTALKRLGSAYYALGRHAEARDAWVAAFKASPTDPNLKGQIQLVEEKLRAQPKTPVPAEEEDEEDEEEVSPAPPSPDSRPVAAPKPRPKPTKPRLAPTEDEFSTAPPAGY